MNFSRSSVATLVFAFACITLGACTQGTDDPSTASAAAGDTATCKAMETYDQAVQSAKDTLQSDYDAAMAKFNQDVADAAAKRDAELAALPNTDNSADLYNNVINEYNDAIAPDGPIVKAYNDAVKAAQDKFNKDVQTALAAYNAHPCWT